MSKVTATSARDRQKGNEWFVIVSEECQKEAAKRFNKVGIKQLLKWTENYFKQMHLER
jgi:hypothetical protein